LSTKHEPNACRLSDPPRRAGQHAFLHFYRTSSPFAHAHTHHLSLLRSALRAAFSAWKRRFLFFSHASSRGSASTRAHASAANKARAPLLRWHGQLTFLHVDGLRARAHVGLAVLEVLQVGDGRVHVLSVGTAAHVEHPLCDGAPVSANTASAARQPCLLQGPVGSFRSVLS
jgi:hypothetical protein